MLDFPRFSLPEVFKFKRRQPEILLSPRSPLFRNDAALPPRERTERLGRSEVPSTGPPRHRHKQRHKTQAPARAGPRPRGPRRGGPRRSPNPRRRPRRRRGRPPSTRATPGTRTTTSTTFWATAGTTTRRLEKRLSRCRRGRCRLLVAPCRRARTPTTTSSRASGWSPSRSFVSRFS